METVKETAKKHPAGPGRPKGVPNRQTKELKQMILDALTKKGGVKYLVQQAEENPKAFMALLARVLPMQVTGENGGAIQINFTNTDANL